MTVVESTAGRVNIEGRRAVKPKPTAITAAMVRAMVRMLRDSSDSRRRLRGFADGSSGALSACPMSV
jgi:hypothetical protein